MTFRDPKNPTPRRGEGSRSDASSQGRDFDADEPLRPSRDASSRNAPSGRRAVDTAAERRAPGSRPRPAAPTSSSRSVTDSFANPNREAPRRATAGVDPLAARSRQARTAPPPAADDPNDPAAWGDLAGDWAEPAADEWEELPAAEPVRRQAPSRRRNREPARTRARTRPSFNLPAARMPAIVGQTDLLTDQISGLLIGANLLSLVVMIVRVATGLGRLPPAIVVHLDAAGFPDLWATPAVLWRLPLIAGMVLLMNFVVAWFISPIDRFAARFVLAAALGVQLIVWVAVLQLV